MREKVLLVCSVRECVFFVGAGKIVRWWMLCVAGSGAESTSEDA